MDRLTEKAYGIAQTVEARTEYNGKVCYKTCEDICKAEKNKCNEGCPIQGVISRLAAYEDTGLTPDEIPHWIPAGERLPEEHETEQDVYDPITLSDLVNVAVLDDETGKRFVCDDITSNGKWINFPNYRYTITHWMPLPKTPKEENDA